MLNETHDPLLRSWLASAQRPGTDYPIQNLPHGIFRRRGPAEEFRGGVAIGDAVLDMRAACAYGVFTVQEERLAADAASGPTLNALMALGPAAWSALRRGLSRVLREGASEAEVLRDCLVPQDEAEFALPAAIGDYTDFFTSWHHMINAGRIFQPANPELPNFKWMPLAYHGRASSVAISGTPVRRPMGQARAPGASTPAFGPTQALDYELELGFFVGRGNARGEAIPIDEAGDQIFGMCLLNDWSARDVQGCESQPLGPFLAKNFLTTISPWIVTSEALAPFQCALPRSEDDTPAPLNLRARSGQPQGFDIQLQAALRASSGAAQEVQLSRSSFREAYWSTAQMLTHHAEGGCRLRPGDLMGTGTQSGPGPGEQGCLLELTQGGRQAVRLPDGGERRYLLDGDTVILRGWCERSGFARIGFGECVGTVIPAQVQRT